MPRTIISINSGSSSLKFVLSQVGPDGPHAVAAGKIEEIGTAPHLIARDAAGKVLAERRWDEATGVTHETFLDDLFRWVEEHLGEEELVAVGHRVVHGGVEFAAPVIVTPEILDKLDRLSPLAPLHQPHNLAAIRAALAVRPHLPQVACFDTAFHRTAPPVATRFALPRALEDEGVRRYGFHGISYEYIARRLAQLDPVLAGGRVVAAHLGNGASLCAVKEGRSIDTTMGFTALDGLMMGTRCGALDPGVLLYFLEEKHLAVEEVRDLLYNRSGLLGVSGLASDMRTLLASPAAPAREAVELFTYRIACSMGNLAVALGGLDGIVFTAGIGENAPPVRAQVCERLGWLGVELDAAANEANAPVISTQASRVRVRVVPTDEEGMIAIHAFDLVGAAKGTPA